jgi:hypothetical protein
LKLLDYEEFKDQFLVIMRLSGQLKETHLRFLTDRDHVNLNGYLQELITKYKGDSKFGSQKTRHNRGVSNKSTTESFAPSRLSRVASIAQKFRPFRKTAVESSIYTASIPASIVSLKRKNTVPKFAKSFLKVINKESIRKSWEGINLIVESISKAQNLNKHYDKKDSEMLKRELEKGQIKKIDYLHYSIHCLMHTIKIFLQDNSEIVFPIETIMEIIQATSNIN